MKQKERIISIRSTIDNIDNTILSLLKLRLNCAKEIGKLKKADNREKWDPRREEEIMQRLLNENAKILPEETITSIFSEIISTCRKLQ